MTRPRRHNTAIAALVYKHWRGDLRDLADTAGIDNATLHRILNGRAVPHFFTAVALSRAMEVPLQKISECYDDSA